jgi:pSer/pThr/pTyr-binding forkhead associated (FHA) protein
MSGPIVLALRVLLAISLYAFLGWAFYSLWRDIKQQGILLAARQVPPITLMIYHPGLAPQSRHFTQAEVTIGRDPACECPLNDEAVSARHARLSYHHNQWWLEDLKSTNGVLLNHQKLDMATVITSEDELIFGKTRMLVSLTGDILMPPTRRIPNE